MKFQRVSLDGILDLLRTNIPLVIALILLFVSLIPYYILGQDVGIGIHDTFDSYLIWYDVLAESNMLFAGQLQTVPIIMDGLPRLVYGSEFNVLLWLFILFDPCSVYILNLTAMRVVAFAGMYLLLRNHSLTEQKHQVIVAGVALCFSLLPFYPSGGLSVPSLPLALYVFLNIRSGSASKMDWLILLLIPFYSSVIFSYMFFLAVMGFLWLWDLIRSRNLGLRLFGATALMTGEFMLVEYRLLLGVFFGEGFVSHRAEFEISDISILDALEEGLTNFLQGQYHAPSLHGLVIFFSIIFALVLVFLSRSNIGTITLLLLGLGGIAGISVAVILKGYRSTVSVLDTLLSSVLLGSYYPFPLIAAGALLVLLVILLYLLTKRVEAIRAVILESSETLKMIALFLGMSALFSLWYGLWSSVLLLPWKEQFFILRAIQFSRIHWLHPLLWYVLFAVSLRMINDGLPVGRVDSGKILALALIVLQIVVILPNTWATSAARVANHRPLTYREFVAEEMFQQIEDDIGLPQESYRVISIGFHPSVAQFNGFYTLDGYFNNYPLEYKHRFRNIIAYELAKNSQVRDYFDNWGSRCYILTAEIGLDFYITKDRGIVLNNLELNVTAMNEMNLSYIFSAVNITNHASNNLQFIGLYQHPDSAWNVYVYEIL